MTLDGRTAIVTGGASGIGLAVARLFAAEGCRVAIADRTPAAGEPPVDVTDAKQVQALVRGFGRLDILMNGTAIYPVTASLVETPESVWDEVLSVNLKGVFLCCKAATRRCSKAAAEASLTCLRSGPCTARPTRCHTRRRRPA